MIPVADTTDVTIHPHVTLAWSLEEKGDTVESYNLYLGENSLPQTASYSNLTETSYNIPSSDLKLETLYRWKVVAKVGGKNYASETLSFTTSSAVAITNSFANGNYLWFDVNLQDSSNATVDFLAVKKGDTNTDRSKTTVTAMDDTNGTEPLAGKHFRDVFKRGESHRVVLYNLDVETSYDIYAYFRDDGGIYNDFDESVLTAIITTAEFTDLTEDVDQVAYVGQNLIIPGTSKIPLADLEQSGWGIFPNYIEVFTMQNSVDTWGYGADHDDVFSNAIVEFDGNNHYMIITGILQKQEGLYKKYFVGANDDYNLRYGINLEIRKNF